MRISDWSSDVCSSDLNKPPRDMKHELSSAAGLDHPAKPSPTPPANAQSDAGSRSPPHPAPANPTDRSEARRDGKERVSTSRSRSSQIHKTKNITHICHSM